LTVCSQHGWMDPEPWVMSTGHDLRDVYLIPGPILRMLRESRCGAE